MIFSFNSELLSKLLKNYPNYTSILGYRYVRQIYYYPENTAKFIKIIFGMKVEIGSRVDKIHYYE